MCFCVSVKVLLFYYKFLLECADGLDNQTFAGGTFIMMSSSSHLTLSSSDHLVSLEAVDVFSLLFCSFIHMSTPLAVLRGGGYSSPDRGLL